MRLKLKFLNFFLTFFTFVFILILIPKATNAQVVIKEKVEIEPLNKLSTSASFATSADFRFVFTSTDVAGYTVNVVGNIQSGSGSSFDLFFPNTSGYYQYSIGFGGISACYEIKTYYGGFLVDSIAGCGYEIFGSGYTNCNDPQRTFFRDLDLSYTFGVGFSVASFYRIDEQLDNNICEGGTYWDPSSPVTISLETQNAEFYNNETKQFAGNSIGYAFNDTSYWDGGVGKYKIVSKLPFNAEPEEAVLTATVGEKTKSINITIYPQSSFIIWDDDFCYSNLVDLFLVPYYFSGFYDWYLKWFNANLRITEGGEYVSFYDEELGETIGDNINVFADNLNKYSLKIDNQVPPSNPVQVVVEYEVLGNVQTDVIMINPPSGEPNMDVYIEEDQIKHNESAALFLSLYRTDCNYPFPANTSFKLTIIEGEEFGELVYTYGMGSRGKNLELNIQNGCCLTLNYEANGSLPDGVDTVVIKVESSIEGIEPQYVNIFIQPEAVRVTLNPAILAPGDTAVIILAKWDDETGAYLPFEPDQIYEIGIIEGCGLGELLASDGTKAEFFSDMQGQMRFIAAENAEPESEVVMIKVGIRGDIIWGKAIKGGENEIQSEKTTQADSLLILTEKEIISNKAYNQLMATKEKFNAKIDKLKTSEDKKEMLKKRFRNYGLPGIISTSSTLAALCVPPPEFPYSDLFGNGKVTVGDDCLSLEECFGVPYPEFVQYKIIPSGNNNPDICSPNTFDPQTGLTKIQNGGFSALDWRFGYSQKIDAEPCFDKEKNLVRFNMILTDVGTNQNSIILKPEAIFEICEENIVNANLILIRNSDQLLSIIRQFPEQIPVIRADMASSLSRYNAQIIKYKFLQEIVSHETGHKKDYEFYLNSLKTYWLDGKVMDYTITCSEFNSDTYATELAKIKYANLVEAYVKEVNTISYDRSDDYSLQKSLSVQASLGEYYILLFNFENGIIF